MNRERLVSICIPSYRHEKFLGAAIESALAQTYPNVEIVIVDDGSPDQSYEIAVAFAARYPHRIHVFTHPGRENRGISATVNLALSRAAGVYWSALCSDDVYLPDKTEAQVNQLESVQGLAFSHGRAELIGPGGEPLGGTVGSPAPDGSDEFHCLLERNWIIGPTGLARRDAMLALGDHREGLDFSDWDFWIRLFARYPCQFIDRTLIRYRVHENNTSWGASEELGFRRNYEVFVDLCERVHELGGRMEEPRARGLALLQAAYFAFFVGDLSRADGYLASAFRADPMLLKDQGFLGGWIVRRFADASRASRRLPTDVDGPARFLTWILGAVRRIDRSAGERLRTVLPETWWVEAKTRYESGETWRAAMAVGRTWSGLPGRLLDPMAWRIFVGGAVKGAMPASVVSTLRAMVQDSRAAGASRPIERTKE
jgi:glycosyltransferase involved in cell wall biosynthesis